MSESIPNLDELTTLIGDDRNFVLRIVQPGLAGLMDGSVSTLAPIFATAFATHNSHTVFPDWSGLGSRRGYLNGVL